MNYCDYNKILMKAEVFLLEESEVGIYFLST